MLDHVSISHQSESSSSALLQAVTLTVLGGLILWSKSFTPSFSALTVTPASPINALVKEAFIEGKARNEQEGFERDGYSVRWTMENGLGLVFVVRTCRYTPINKNVGPADSEGRLSRPATLDIYSDVTFPDEAIIPLAF